MMRWTGIMFFVASFLTPQVEVSQGGLVVSAKDSGLGAFAMTPVVLLRMLGDISGVGDLLCSLLLAAAWVNNFSVFVKLPPLMAWIPILIPWCLLSVEAVGWIHLGSLWHYVPFYPWALGIGL